ncbi:hypothetical protein CORC01_10263, partial [Colletotrichum orchidophilum]
RPLTNLDISNSTVRGRCAEDEDRGDLCSILPKVAKVAFTLEPHETMFGTPWPGPSRLQALERGVHGIATQRLAHSALWLVHQCAPIPSIRLVGLDQGCAIAAASYR